jgi:hypothetical protein
MKTVTVATLLVVLISPFAYACGPGDFKISDLHGRNEPRAGSSSELLDSGYLIVTGQVANNCAESAAVRVKATAYDKDGSVITAEEFIPSGTRNIPAKTVYPFKWTFKAGKSVRKITVVPISVLNW